MSSDAEKSSTSYERGEVSDADQMSQESVQSSDSAWEGIFGSSYGFDEDRGWEKGQTAGYLIIGLAALGIAAFNGFISGFEASTLPSF